MAIIG